MKVPDEQVPPRHRVDHVFGEEVGDLSEVAPPDLCQEVLGGDQSGVTGRFGHVPSLSGRRAADASPQPQELHGGVDRTEIRRRGEVVDPRQHHQRRRR